MIEPGSYKYIVPAGDGKGEPVIVDVAAVVLAEKRLDDVSTVNSHTASELLSIFNTSWLTLNDLVGRLTSEKLKADDSHRRARAEALLNCNDGLLEAKGHRRASADLREAMVELDVVVQAAKERLNEIATVLEYIKGKRQAFDNAFRAVKNLIQVELPPHQLRDGNRPAPFSDKRPLVWGAPLVANTESDDSLVLPPGFGTYNGR